MYIDLVQAKKDIVNLVNQAKIMWIDVPNFAKASVSGKSDSANWLAEAVRLSWPVLKRFGPSLSTNLIAMVLGRKNELFHQIWYSPLDLAACLLRSYHTSPKDAQIIAELPQRTKMWYTIRDGWIQPELVASLTKIDSEHAFADAIQKWAGRTSLTTTAVKPIVRAALASSSVAAKMIGKKKGYISDEGLKAHEELLYGAPLKSKAEEIHMLSATQRGTAMEPLILQETELVLNAAFQVYYGDHSCEVSIEEVGLQMSLIEPNKAASPDGNIWIKRALGIVRLDATLEVVKERLAKLDSTDMQLWQLADRILSCLESSGKIGGEKFVTCIQIGLEMKCRGDPEMEVYPTIPMDYYVQIEHTMDVTGLQPYVFVCHMADAFSLSVFTHDSDEWNGKQVYKLRDFYWSKFWPSLLFKTFGYLNNGLVTPTYDIYAAHLFDGIGEEQRNTMETELQTHCGMVTSSSRCVERAMSRFNDTALDEYAF